jgi:hypothetical protein
MDKLVDFRSSAPILGLVLFAFWGTASGQGAQLSAQNPSDSEIRAILVRASIATYAGECPCPEARTGSGALCGRNSAYSRGGGTRPLCYAADVTEAMIHRYREALPK